MKTILVTGGAGFIGSHLCKRLLGEGHRVISLDNYFAGSKNSHIEGVEYREGHTKDIEKHISEKPDLIYHLGEYARVEQSLLEPEIVEDLNVLGTRGVVHFWKKHRCKLVYAGSSTKFGDAGVARYTTPYASTKAANTELVKEVGEKEKLPYAITYFYNVYGSGERAGIYGTLIEMFKQMYQTGAPLTVVSPGTQVRNFTHIDDIVDALMLVGEKGHGDEYGLGNEKAYSILDVAKMFGREVVMLPERAGNRMTSGIDTSKTKALGWNPHRSLEEYIRNFVSTTEHGKTKEKRVLVFSTTFYPTVGPAEEALITLMRKMPDVQFDIVTTAFSPHAKSATKPTENAHIHRIGSGRPSDKYLLPLLGLRVAHALHKKHDYLFTWSLMASYGGLAGALFKIMTGVPLLVTLADQDLARASHFARLALKLIFSRADQVYGVTLTQEKHAARITQKPLRQSMGHADAFANQLRYAYAEILSKQPSVQNPKKKILIFSLAYFPRPIGGAEVAIKEITDRTRDIEFHLVTPRFEEALSREEKIGNVHLHRIGSGASYFSKMLFIPRAAFSLIRLNRIHRFDALWPVMTYMLFPVVLSRIFGVSLPYALTLQDGDPYEHVFKRWFIIPLLPILRAGFRGASVIQTISKFLAEWGRRMGTKAPIEVIPNGVDIAHFSKDFSTDVVNEVKFSLNKKMGDVFLITTSRLTRKNALDDVIRALPKLPDNLHFVILGTGKDEAKLKELAERLDVSERVRFVGFVSHEDMPKYLRASDIFIRPSRSEGMGNSFIEAMAAGLPVIATQEGGIADFLFDEKRNPSVPVTGWAVDKDSPEQIAEAVKEIMSDPEKVRAVVKTARVMVSEKYDWDLIARDMKEKVFEKLFTS